MDNGELNMLSTKNVCITLGVIFGLLVYTYDLFAIPCTILLMSGAIQSFEISLKRKKLFENHIDLKLKSYEYILGEMKKENEKLKSDIESIKIRQNVSAVYGVVK